MNPSNPRPYAQVTPLTEKPMLPEAASQTWLANSFVTITGTGASAKYQRAATSPTTLSGLCPTPAVGAANPVPPDYLQGLKHAPFRLDGQLFEISITTATDGNIGASGVTFAGGGTGGVALAPNQQYGMRLIASGPFIGMQTLDVSNTTNKVFEIVSIHPQVSPTEPNGRVIVKIIPAAIAG